MTRLMDTIGKSVKDRCKNANLTPMEDEIRKCILRVFGKTGNPPTVKEIMEIVTAPSEDVVDQAIRKLRRADILTTQAGVITSAYPFSADKTRHRVIFTDGHPVNALCATDAFGIHFMLGENITVKSVCPECEHEITIDLKEGRIASRDPKSVIEYVKVRESCGCTADTCCPNINFFCGRTHLERWKAGNPADNSGEVYSLEEALEDGRMIFWEFLK
jgi:hypothetical protein